MNWIRIYPSVIHMTTHETPLSSALCKDNVAGYLVVSLPSYASVYDQDGG